MLGFLHLPGSDKAGLKAKPSNTSLTGASSHLNGASTPLKPDAMAGLTSPRLRPATPSRTPSGLTVGKRQTRQFVPSLGFQGGQIGGQIKDEFAVVRQRCQKELGSRVPHSAFDTSYNGLLEWIRSERLTRVPHKGGHWDRVLIKALGFAEQLNHFTQAIGVFAEDCAASTNLMFGHCLLLLELGCENASALERAFDLFHKFAMELVPLLRCVDLFPASLSITDSLNSVFSDLLNIVTAVAISFWSAVHGGRESTTIDVYRSFGHQIETYHSHVSKVTQAMWAFALPSDDETDREQLETLQKLLSPQDSLLSFLAAKRINTSGRPAQFTCTWFQKDLVNFVRGNERILLVEGKSGSGKTTLANWTLDRMQRPVGRKTLTTISYLFNRSITGQNTSLSLVKTLMYQLLFQRIGDVQLFNAIHEVVNKSLFLQSAEEQENRLWSALNKALYHLHDTEDNDIVIIVDGVDGIEGQKGAAQKVSQRLQDLANRINAVRLVLFSQPLEMAPKYAVRVELTPDVLHDDLATMARSNLSLHPFFNKLKEPDQEKIVEQLVQTSGTSALWLSLASRYLNLQHQSFEKALEAILPTSKSITETVSKLASAMQLDQDAKNVVSYVLTAERPLLYDEIRLLLQAQPDRYSMIQRTVDLHRITAMLKPFIIVTEGLLTVRHFSIKQALTAETNPSRWLSSMQDRHKDFLTRILIYANTCMLGEQQPTLDALGLIQVGRKLHGHSLLEYTVRYWALHFKQTPFYKPSGPLTLPKDFHSVFPGSVMFALLEDGCWTMQLAPLDAINLHITAYRVREALFGPEKGCVLQTLITIAKIYDMLLSRPTDATEWYFKAMKICFKIIGSRSDMTVILCQTILRISEKYVVAKRSSLMDWREETMLIMISIYSQTCGSSSKEVIEIRQKIIEFYMYIHEEHKCEEHRKIIEIILRGERGGSGGGLTIDGEFRQEESMTLKKGRRPDEPENPFALGFLGGYFAESTEITITFEMVAQIIILIEGHIKGGRFEKAEELYIELWLRLTEYCQHTLEIEWHSKKVEIMISYSRFLHVHKRSSEASAILLCIWREYEHHEITNFELINILLKEVADFMMVLCISSAALAVYRKCWSWFKYAHKEHTSVFKEIETSITTISTEIVKTSLTTETSETIIREIFESSLSSSETVTTTTVELCKSLTSTYIKEERYSEAIISIESVLRKSWSSFFFSSEVSIDIKSKFTSENIALVMQLSHCYLMQKRYEKVEEIYIRLYRIYRKSYSIDHEEVTKYTAMILAFYEKYGLFSKAISFYQELLVEYRIFYSAHHVITIRTLYALGDLCRRHYLTHGYWIEYYLEIVNVLNKGSLYCHEEALRALIIVAEHHYEALRFSEALVYFKSIFATFTKYGLTYKYFESIIEVQKLIEHYFRSIEESQIEIEIHISMIKELREATLKYYEKNSAIVLGTTLVLATVCRRSEVHQYQAISLYEFYSSHSKTVTKEVKSSLQHLYYKRITTTKETVSTETIERAVTMTYERYTSIREQYTCTHEKSLTVLKELIQLWHKQSKKELIIKELRMVIIEIIKSIKKSEEFVETGRFLAEIFVFCGFQKEAYEFIYELRQQIIYKVTYKESKFNITLVDRACLAFIASFEYYVRANWGLSLSALMADLIAEYSYYYRFSSSIKAKASIDIVFAHGSRIRRILMRTQRMTDFVIVEEELIKYFIGHETEVLKYCGQPSVKIFVKLLLKYCATRQVIKSFIATAGHAAIAEIEILLKQNHQDQAVELAKCAFYFLRVHEGLDDPTEITMGFRLCLLMSGRGARQKATPAMLQLSQAILKEVFVICENFKINVARIQLSELNELIEMIGEQKDYKTLHWLLQKLWQSRESQTSWPKEALLKLGMRLVQAEFAAGHTSTATRLCEDIVYNIRRVYGPRHQSTLNICELLASLYTSIGVKHASGSDKRDQELAKFYFKKALTVQEDALKAFAGWDTQTAQDDDDDDDLFSNFNESLTTSPDTNGHVFFSSHKEEVEAAVRHLRKLRLAMQRLGGWTKSQTEFERLTNTIWQNYNADLKLKEEEVKAINWKAEHPGNSMMYDCFDVPQTWGVVSAVA